MKTRHEQAARFFEEPTRDKFRQLLQFNTGESALCDFKLEWPSNASLSKQILALANAGGGALIAGVKEDSDGSLTPVGMAALSDKADLDKGIRTFVPENLASTIEVLDYDFKQSEYASIVGKKFQIIFVTSISSQMPYVCRSDGEKIRKATIYVRRPGGVAEADYEELQRILNRRIEDGNSSAPELQLREDIEQLKVLYEFMPRYQSLVSSMMLGLSGQNYFGRSIESFPDFIERMIASKKGVIGRRLGIQALSADQLELLAKVRQQTPTKKK